MKKLRNVFCFLLALALLVSLGASAAFADDGESVGEEAAAVEEEAAPLVCGEGETLTAEAGAVICEAGGTVFNNGAVVYNNGGTVFNNLGVCYNNAGLCYNNAGTVYLNGGRAFNNAGTAVVNGGELIDRTLPLAEPVEEEVAESVEEEAAEPVEEAAEPVEEEAAEPAEEEAAEPVEEAAEPVEEEAEVLSYVLTAPVFEPLTAGYRRTELPVAAASLENTGETVLVVKAARVNGNSANSFTVEYEKNVTVAPGETNDTAWKVSPKPFLRPGVYEARLVLILESGEKLEIPFSLTVEKA